MNGVLRILGCCAFAVAGASCHRENPVSEKHPPPADAALQETSGRFRALSLNEKTDDPDLSFCVTFDEASVVADRALGRADSTTFAGGLDVRGQRGFDGQNAFSIREDEQLRYDAVKNISPREGSIGLWLMARNYSPADVRPTDANPCHKSYLYVKLTDGSRWIKIYLYQYYNEPEICFFWQSERAAAAGKYVMAKAYASAIHEGDWFHLTATWDENEIRLYLNGERAQVSRIPSEFLEPADFSPRTEDSFIGVRDRMWRGAPNGDDTGMDTVVDEVKIYSRALTEGEIRRRFASLLTANGSLRAPADTFDLALNGVDDGGELDRLEIEADFRALPPEIRRSLTEGKGDVTWLVTPPSGPIQSGKWPVQELRPRLVVSNVTQPGEYRVTVTADVSGRVFRTEQSIVRPDTSWHGNTLGLEDVVPSPWTPLSYDAASGTVHVWNRDYVFDGSPLPKRIRVGGESLLNRGPELLAHAASGAIPIRWRMTDCAVSNSFVIFRGTGESRVFEMTWETRVDFDGSIRFDCVVHGEPTLTSLKWAWDVDRRFADYVMTPVWKQSGNGQYAAEFPGRRNHREATVLWLTSRQAGFCWTVGHDANVIADPDSRPVRAVVDDQGGHCAVQLIDREIPIPEGTAYHAYFIATPSRPLPDRFRTTRIGGYGEPLSETTIEFWGSQGLTAHGNLRPTESLEQAIRIFKGWGLPRACPLNLATMFSARCVEGRYFRKYWEIPGATTFNMKYIPTGKKEDEDSEQLVFSVDPRFTSDLTLANYKALYERAGDYLNFAYYDMCDNQINGNDVNGVPFNDAFGRRITPLLTASLRNHILRTVRYMHGIGRPVLLHFWNFYNPVIHGLGDYWYPGEQYSDLIRARKSPYVYSDDIPDEIYRTELNMQMKGSGILFLGNLKRANPAYGTEEQTRAMCTKLLLNDVPVCMAFEDPGVIRSLWAIAQRYALDSATVHPYDRQKDIVSSNPAVAVTYYRCPDGRRLAILGNLTAKDQQATITLSAVRPDLDRVTDEETGQSLPLEAGRFSVSIPSRLFRIVGF